MILKPTSLADYKILVTGGSGFLGRRAISMFRDWGADVVTVDLVPCQEELPMIEGKGLLRSYSGDLDSSSFIDKILQAFSAEGKRGVVLHLSGLSHAGECKKNPELAFQRNVIQVFNLLEACRR